MFSNDFQEELKFDINIASNLEEIPKMNAPGRKNLCSKSPIETPEQTVKFALKVYKNDIRTYLSFTACPMSSVWDFEHVFSN